MPKQLRAGLEGLQLIPPFILPAKFLVLSLKIFEHSNNHRKIKNSDIVSCNSAETTPIEGVRVLEVRSPEPVPPFEPLLVDLNKGFKIVFYAPVIIGEWGIPEVVNGRVG